MDELPLNTLVSFWALGLGIIFGATAQKTNFCAMGAISDIVFMGSWNRFRAWFLAIAVAMIGSQLLYYFGQIDLSQSIYTSTNFGWIGAIIGGLLFGFGMTMAGGCGHKNLVRLGAGNLKSLVVLMFLGFFAYTTLRGLIAIARVQMESMLNIDLLEAGIASQSMPDIIAATTAMELQTMKWLIPSIFVVGLLFFCFKSGQFRSSYRNIIAGVVIGLLVSAAWYVTGVIGFDEFEPLPLVSLTMIAPVGEGLLYLMIFTGATINFGIAAVAGIILGSFLMAVTTRTFRIEAFDNKQDFIRHIVGATMMGVGGVLALGCTVGQGITGMSTLAIGSLISLVSIIMGAFSGLKYLEHGSLKNTIKALLENN